MTNGISGRYILLCSILHTMTTIPMTNIKPIHFGVTSAFTNWREETNNEILHSIQHIKMVFKRFPCSILFAIGVNDDQSRAKIQHIILDKAFFVRLIHLKMRLISPHLLVVIHSSCLIISIRYILIQSHIQSIGYIGDQI